MVLGYKDFRCPTQLKGLRIPHPYDVEMTRLNGSDKGLGAQENVICNLLGATGLDWEICDPTDRILPPLWRAAYWLVYMEDPNEVPDQGFLDV
ncbi:hypothetical protein PG990_001032 [Apiospora arundinis]|uniref:Uncharacterized protein n=1 Tax=Apiospora arundinis TaxID=335852 RepID=A0ABR2I1Z1_9PEZI